MLRLCIALALLLTSASPNGGALVLVGGGTNLPVFMDKFQELAGGAGARVVVIPTALDADRLTPAGLALLQTRSQQSFGPGASVLHTTNRGVADSEKFVQPLRQATAVWILGGDERQLADAYAGTRTETEIKALLARGGVVGGSSAGAIIQGSVLLNGTLLPAENVAVLGTRPAFDLLPNSIVIPHWSARKLNSNLLAAAFAKYPSRLCIGIDESTAAIVRVGTLQVLGDGHVAIYDGKGHNGQNYLLLSSGQTYDLIKRAAVPA